MSRYVWHFNFTYKRPLVNATHFYHYNSVNSRNKQVRQLHPQRHWGNKLSPTFPLDGKELARHAQDLGLIPRSGRIPWRRKWQPTPVLLHRKFHGWKEPGGLQSMGSQRVAHDWTTSFSLICKSKNNKTDSIAQGTIFNIF